jgi:hypothetical protein
VGGVEVPSMGEAGGATIQTEKTRIRDRMLNNIIYCGSLMIAKMCRFD